MSRVSKYEEMMATMCIRQIQDHLKVIGDTLMFTDTHREVLLYLIDELDELLNRENQHEDR